jgi:hypothetical protein
VSARLALCGVRAAIGYTIYDKTGVRVRNYALALDKLLDGLPAGASAAGSPPHSWRKVVLRAAQTL